MNPSWSWINASTKLYIFISKRHHVTITCPFNLKSKQYSILALSVLLCLERTSYVSKRLYFSFVSSSVRICLDKTIMQICCLVTTVVQVHSFLSCTENFSLSLRSLMVQMEFLTRMFNLLENLV